MQTNNRVTPEHAFSVFLFVVVSLAALVTATSFLAGTVRRILSNPQTLQDVSELALLLGLIVLSFVALRSLVSDIRRLFPRERQIVCGAGQNGTRYDALRLLAKAQEEVVIIGQNMKTLLSDPDFLPTVARRLHNKKNLRIHFVLTTFDAMKAISESPQAHLHTSISVDRTVAAEVHYRESVEQIARFVGETLPSEDRNRFSVSFHPGASSLSAIVIDANAKSHSTLVFTPKWAVDAQPDNRLFCVLRRSETPDLFNLLNGSVKRLRQCDSLSLHDVVKKLNIPIASTAVQEQPQPPAGGDGKPAPQP